MDPHAPGPQQPVYPAAPTPPAAPPERAAVPGRTLGIVGLVLAVFTTWIGMVISIVALVISRRAGARNGPAVAGIIVGAVLTVLSLVITITVVAAVAPVVGKCLENGSATVVVNGEAHECPPFLQSAGSAGDRSGDAYAGATSITGTDVTLAGSSLSSLCWDLTVPDGYIVSPESTDCTTELRLDDGTATGASLTSISLKPQIGATSTIEGFFDTIRKFADQGITVIETKKVTVDGRDAGFARVQTSTIPQDMYFIPDDSAAFSASNGTITSYLLTGPSAETDSAVEAVAQSLWLKG